MKNILIFLITASLCSCTTPLTITNVDYYTNTKEAPKMEFIGFQNISPHNYFVKNFGAELEKQNFAFNSQSSYFNDIDLQNLSLYKTKNRYISFINVEKHIYVHNDAIKDNESLEVAGWCVAGVTAFALFPIYVPMLCCANKNICEISLIGKYQIFIYDSQKKEIVSTTPIDIRITDTYDGQYSHKKTDRSSIDNHYKNVFQHQLLETYAKIYDQLVPQ